MDFHEKVPGTARDALIGELLGDVGHVHDEIKAIPKLLEQSMRDTLNLVADAVEDAEDTVFELQKQTKEYAEAAATKAGLDLGVQLSNAIHTSLDQAFEPALLRASSKLENLENLENLITKASGSLRDTHATRFNYIILASFMVLVVIMIGSLAWLSIKAQDVNETNKWFYNEYKAQRKTIDSLPESVKQKYNL